MANAKNSTVGSCALKMGGLSEYCVLKVGVWCVCRRGTLLAIIRCLRCIVVTLVLIL